MSDILLRKKEVGSLNWKVNWDCKVNSRLQIYWCAVYVDKFNKGFLVLKKDDDAHWNTQNLTVYTSIYKSK